ncbi:MAG: NAD(P)H-dependent oxidoreductase [Dehalococcoidia bacterium]|jgi:putative NADPH-quinone reductase
MKVLALNSSPRVKGQSKTELMLSHLVKGMKEAGAEVEVVDLRKKKINYCKGCYTCWTKTPGVCVHKDDMALELYPKWLESDIVVYASPLYYYTVNAEMKAFIERTLPILIPYLKRGKGTTGHPLRSKFPQSVIVSVAGFPDDSVFDALRYWSKTVFGRSGGLLAEIYRPAAESMVYSGKRDIILDAVEQAGKELIRDKKVSPATMAVITQPVADPDVIADVANIAWQPMIDAAMTPAEMQKKGGPEFRPDSPQILLALMSFAFNPLKANGKSGVLQFKFTGQQGGEGYLTISNGNCSRHMGLAEKADCTVEGPFEVWADIVQGKADGAKMAMEGKYKAQGDIALLMTFGQ